MDRSAPGHAVTGIAGIAKPFMHVQRHFRAPLSVALVCAVLLTAGFIGKRNGNSSGNRHVAAISQLSLLRAHIPTGNEGIALGATIQETVQDKGRQLDTKNGSLIDWYAHLVGDMPTIVNVGGDWVHKPNFDPQLANTILQRGAIPMWTWMPENYNADLYQPSYRLSAIANGAFDSYLKQFATDVAAWNHPLMIRLAHEMNGNWYSFSTANGNANGNTPADYVAMWRHVHDIFQAAGATNVQWVWCVNVDFPGTGPIAANYPGDAYVDWVAMDGYNWGNEQGYTWQSLYQVFNPTYQELIALTGKPMMIAETGSVEQGGDKAAWISQGLLHDLPTLLPQIRAVMWFEANMKGDWRVHTSDTALNAFRAVAASPIYQGKMLIKAPAPQKGNVAARARTADGVPR